MFWDGQPRDRRSVRVTGPDTDLTVRTATVADAPSIAEIGRVGFPAVHNEIVGVAFAAAVVEQTYSIEALSECITRCAAADDAEFLVAERDGWFSAICTTTAKGLNPNSTASTSTSSARGLE